METSVSGKTMLREFLIQRKETVTARWSESIMETYPADTSRFLRKEKDRFNNPVGHAIIENLNSIYEELLGGSDDERLSGFLDNIIRIRSVQDFSPREAVAFVFQLKKVIREELGKRAGESEIVGEFSEFERKIDELALLAFQVYAKCREDLFEIRTRELRRRSDRLMDIVNGKADSPRGVDTV
jgi:hypothetical protein